MHRLDFAVLEKVPGLAATAEDGTSKLGAVHQRTEKRRVRLIRVAARGPELRIASATPALVAASCQAKAAA